MGKYKFVLLVFPKKNVGTYFYTCTFASSKFLNAKIVCF